METKELMDLLTFMMVICVTGAVAEWYFSRGE